MIELLPTQQQNQQRLWSEFDAGLAAWQLNWLAVTLLLRRLGLRNKCARIAFEV